MSHSRVVARPLCLQYVGWYLRTVGVIPLSCVPNSREVALHYKCPVGLPGQVLEPTCWVTVGQFLNGSIPQFPHVYSRYLYNTYDTGLL